MKIPYIGLSKNAFGKFEGWKVGKLESFRDAKQPYNLATLQHLNSIPYSRIAKNAFAALFLFSVNIAYAQTGKNGLGEETVVIVKDYKPKLSDAVKIDVLPAQENIETKKPEITYQTPAFIFKMEPYKAKLNAPAIKGGKVDEIHHNYAKLMFGNYADINGEFFYNTLRNKNNLLTLQAKHHSGNGPVDNSRFSENLFDIYAKRIFSGHSLTGNIGYQRNANHFYGQIPGDTITENTGDSTKQAFNDIYFNSTFARIKADTGKFSYGAALGFYNFNDLYNHGELGFKIGAYGIEPFQGNNIKVDADYNFWRNKMLLNTSNRSLLNINAAYNFKYNGFRALAGFNTANESDSGSNNFHFFPNARIEADVIDKYLTLFGGITGRVQENTFKTFARENPFIDPDLTLKNTTEKLNLFGGAKGSFSSNTSFSFGLSYKTLQYLPFYINDSVDSKKFDVDYEGLTSLVNVHAEAGVSIMENFNLGATVNYYKYGLSVLAKPYHRPAFDATISGRYVLANKITIASELFFQTKRYGGAWSKDSVTNQYVIKQLDLGNIIDLNAGVSYAFGNIKGLKAHLQLKNILGTKYPVWNYYPGRGFQITGGVSYSFL